ncbi:MAG: hypothetical protein JWO38_8291 [Gemmataceae bacterium]|nr:hypothetical protein [Gemmataceae bacterium]
MTPHERELILGVANELRTADRSEIDPEADRLIRTEIASQPNADYVLTQRVIVQQLALRQAQARIDELEAKVRSAGGGNSGRSFLGGAGGAEAQAPPAAGAQPGAQQPAPAGGGVGSFLKTAAAAAAGTIGGQLIFDGLRNLAAGHLGGPGAGELFGGSGAGGFLPGGLGSSFPDNQVERSTPDRDQDWGGGGDFGSDQKGTDAQDDLEVEDDDTSDEEEWKDDEADDSGSTDDGGGGDW